MNKHNRMLALALVAAIPAAATGQDEQHSVTWGGFAKLSATVTDYEYGSLDGNALKDFHIPQLIPVEGAGESEGPETDFSARETRFWMKSAHEVGGHKIGTHIEMDFMATGTPDERTTNSYNPRIRHAYLSYDNWLFGQTWSTFFNVGALPEGADFIGPTESTVFVRQAQIRYSNGPWMFAVENPHTTVTPNGGGARIAADDGVIPDMVLRYNAGAFTVAAIARQLKLAESNPDSVTGDAETATGFGVSVSGKVPVGSGGNDIRYMLNYGSGIGRYIGLNYVNDVVMDADGSLETIDLASAFVSYHHVWSDRYRSNLTLGMIEVDNDVELVGASANKTSASLHANLIYSPVPNLDFAYELIYGTREIESGADGSMLRFQFAAKYTF